MDFSAFNQSLTADQPPAGLSLALQALWHDEKGSWLAAHTCAQDQEDRDGAWVHAYLHRKEGDPSNAAYWYRRANRPVAITTLQAEWEQIARALLEAQ